jgi:methionyl-tRNA synthetase
MPKFYITTAIDYVNSKPHVGTAYEKILADAMARWRRLKGDDVYFLMGNDEHSQQVFDKAAELKLDTHAYCDQMEEEFRKAWARLDIKFDIFIRTTWPQHVRACQEIFRRIRAKGDIFKAMYNDLYCIGCEASKKESDLVNGACPNHPTKPIKRISEENYFFRLSKYAEPVKKLLQRGDFIDPAFRANEMLQVIENGLQDISISRKTTKWGVPIPDDPDQVMYVWFDALINYITGAGFPDEPDRFKRTWPADVHVVGKDITRFHTVIWPAMLIAADLEPPKMSAVHGFVYIRKGEERYKISKTLGTALNPIELADQFGSEVLRYYLLSEVAFGQDGDFSTDKLIDRNNAELANQLGNLLNRIVSMVEKYCGGAFVAPREPLPGDGPLRDDTLRMVTQVPELMDRWQFHTALARIMAIVGSTNGYIEANAPWTLNKQGKSAATANCLYQAAEALRICAILLSSVIPSSSAKILEQLGLDPAAALRLDAARAWQYIPEGTRVRKGPVLFQKVDTGTQGGPGPKA